MPKNLTVLLKEHDYDPVAALGEAFETKEGREHLAGQVLTQTFVEWGLQVAQLRGTLKVLGLLVEVEGHLKELLAHADAAALEGRGV